VSPRKGEKLGIADKRTEGLEEFADCLEAGEDIAQRFNGHKVVLDLEPTPYGPELVKDTRDTLRASQTVFARFLGVSAQTVRAWEQGAGVARDGVPFHGRDPKQFQVLAKATPTR